MVTHFRVRLRAAVTNPPVLATLILTGLAGWVYWPGPLAPEHFGGEAAGLVAVLLWLHLWPMLACRLVGGRATGGRRGEGGENLHPMPSLPVGRIGRVVAEASVVILFLVGIRLAGVLLGGWWLDSVWRGDPMRDAAALRWGYLERTGLGFFLALPFILAWTAPSRTHNEYWSRPLLLVLLVFGAYRLGLLDRPEGMVGVGLVLSAGVLAVIGRSWALPVVWRPAAGPAAGRVRPFQAPESQYRSDLRRELWRRQGLTALILLTLEVVTVAADPWLGAAPVVHLFTCNLFFGFFFALVVLRPMGSQLATAGALGYGGYRYGDYAAAWSVLPVRREVVLRGVYAHALLAGTVLWLLLLGILALLTRIDVGYWGVENDLGRSLLWLLAPCWLLVPSLAGGLTAAAAGDRWRGVVSVVALTFGFFGNMILFRPSDHTLQIALLVGLALLGALPPLVHLRAPAGRK